MPQIVPLTEAQAGLWYAQRLDPANPIFNTGQYLDINGPLDETAFTSAVNRACDEAEALALCFVERPEGPGQYVDPALTPRLQIVDCAGEADPAAAALEAIRRDMATPVDPLRDRLARQVLYRLGKEHYYWAQQIHHLATDGYGMVLLTSRIAELYAAATVEGRREGRAFASLAGVWAEDAAYRISPEREADARWWRDAMAGMEDVGSMAPGKPQSAFTFHRHAEALPEATRKALLAFAKQKGLSWPDVLTALTAAYCRRFTGTPEIVLGVPYMGRMGSASARVPAMVMNVLPLRVAPDEAAPLADFCAEIARATGDARKAGRYRSEQLRRDLGLLGGHKRLYGALVNVQPFDRPPRFAGLEVTLHVTGTGPVEDIDFTFRGDAMSGLSIEVDANPDLYSTAEVRAHVERLGLFLTRAMEAQTLADIPTATPAEEQRELEAFNATAHELPDTTLTALLTGAMTAQPASEALRFAGRSLTYAELDRRSAALAETLRGRGVTAESIVAIALPRSLDLVIALIAVLRAGGAYLPLDTDHPPERIAAIMESAKPQAVLATDDPHGLYGSALLTPQDWRKEPQGDALPEVTPDQAAYVIYTSGSTGTPKGVVVTHRAIVNRLLWMDEHYAIGPQDRILQKTPATFDVSVWEFFLALIRGGVLVVAPPGAHRDPAALAALIRDEGITTLHFVPSMLAAFCDAPESAGLQLARVFCSGEELPADLRDRFHRRIRAELHNLYGPTEAAVDVSYWPADAQDRAAPVPIGWPVWNTRLVLLDDRRRPVPPGVAGHLYLGGVQLARGYLGQPELTAERFIADPFHEGERLYMTGDLARRRADGAVIFLGRADHQVKIRGLRIELGEVEAAIAQTGLVRSAVVLERDQRLVAYILPEDSYSETALRNRLAERLPDYMVPAAIMALEDFPVTANGKLDRKALPEPRFAAAGGGAPSTPTQQKLAAFYGTLLDVEGAIGVEDDFFALGGDSLSAMQLLLHIREEWGRDPGLAALFEHPDIAGLALCVDALAEGGTGDDSTGPLIRLTRGESDRPPLFMIHPAGGLCWGYRTLASTLDPQRTVYGLQSPALAPDRELPGSIDDLAKDYTARIIDIAPAGPVHLAGWSVGGIIAQAIAVELEAAGRTVGLVALLDAYPAECWRAEPEPTAAQALRALLAIAGYDPEAHPELETREQVLTFLRAGNSPLGNLPPRALDGVVRVVLDTNRLIRGHYHRPFGGRLTHIRAALDHRDRPDLTADLWMPYAGSIDRLNVPFLHPQLTGPEASTQIAPALCKRMDEMERVGV
ncbi:amino acid adenylation domain-containing protein [Altericroceibacterium spongiae]|uniref:Amino acid adenylation domain-containing protein n=1 Tax=Altericroceibacterium spongiae TaxID=2320269 RepID=A0A420EA88_9SPHN|nr:non-ribosomal peptide synthetase [Altericroceibacterium spongiae]RKF17598.1 amino acid adenylation domain-containing protein [Altericroceibacterium spongiae]